MCPALEPLSIPSTFQLRKLKERSKTEVNPRRTSSMVEQSSSRLTNKRRSLLYEESVVENNLEKGVGAQEKVFKEMAAQVKRFTVRREDTPDSDCEKYFSDD